MSSPIEERPMTIDSIGHAVPIVGLLTVIVQAPGMAPAEDESGRISGDKLVAIHACVKYVREASPRSTFDAHLAPSGRLRISGTTGETALFAQCMKEKGYPVDTRLAP